MTITHYELLRAMKFSKGGGGSPSVKLYDYETSGALPLSLIGSAGVPLKEWGITGSTDGVGDLTEGKYKISVVIANHDGEIRTNIYLDAPLMANEILKSDGTLVHADGSTETVTVPQIMTLKGNCTLDVATTVKPADMSIMYKSPIPNVFPIGLYDGTNLKTYDNQDLETIED